MIKSKQQLAKPRHDVMLGSLKTKGKHTQKRDVEEGSTRSKR